MKIYVASSWRNAFQPGVIKLIREQTAHSVYDFRHPAPGNDGFAWGQIDTNWESWTPEEYRKALAHPLAEKGFESDAQALENANACLLVQPCGPSAHLELGYFIGGCNASELDVIGHIGHSAVYYPSGVHFPPELMLKFANKILVGEEELKAWLGITEHAHEGDYCSYSTGQCWHCGIELRHSEERWWTREEWYARGDRILNGKGEVVP